MPTWIIRFDDTGQCVSPATAEALLQHLRATTYSDVLFHSHGWNTDFASAMDQYARFLKAFDDVLSVYPLPGFKPIFVGITWPSVWIADDAGPTMSAVGDVAIGDVVPVVDQIARSLAAPDKGRFYALADAGAVTRDEALVLARLITPTLGTYFEDADGHTGSVPAPETLVDAAARLSSATASHGRLPPVDVIGDDGLSSAQATGFADMIDPRNLLRLFSLFQMKDRAGTVGANGVASLLRGLLGATSAPLRVLGHSFGAKVMLSAICANPPLPRKVASLLLLQPAISHLAMATEVPGRDGPGGYRGVLDRIEGPIFSTFSELDVPLHDVFHLALRRDADLGEARITAAGEPPSPYAALGGYGPRHSGERLLSPIPGPGDDYGDLSPSQLVGLDGSAGRITAHGDVANGFTAWALRRLVAPSDAPVAAGEAVAARSE